MDIPPTTNSESKEESYSSNKTESMLSNSDKSRRRNYSHDRSLPKQLNDLKNAKDEQTNKALSLRLENDALKRTNKFLQDEYLGLCRDYVQRETLNCKSTDIQMFIRYFSWNCVEHDVSNKIPNYKYMENVRELVQCLYITEQKHFKNESVLIKALTNSKSLKIKKVQLDKNFKDLIDSWFSRDSDVLGNDHLDILKEMNDAVLDDVDDDDDTKEYKEYEECKFDHEAMDVTKMRSLLSCSKDWTNQMMNHKIINKYFQNSVDVWYYLKYTAFIQLFDKSLKMFRSINGDNDSKIVIFNLGFNKHNDKGSPLYLICTAAAKWKPDTFMDAFEIEKKYGIQATDLPIQSDTLCKTNIVIPKSNVIDFDISQLKQIRTAKGKEKSKLVGLKMSQKQYYNCWRSALQNFGNNKCIDIITIDKKTHTYFKDKVLPIQLNHDHKSHIGMIYRLTNNEWSPISYCIDLNDIKSKAKLADPSLDVNKEYGWFQNNIASLEILKDKIIPTQRQVKKASPRRVRGRICSYDSQNQNGTISVSTSHKRLSFVPSQLNDGSILDELQRGPATKWPFVECQIDKDFAVNISSIVVEGPHKGYITKWNGENGYGFIRFSESKKADVYVLQRDMRMHPSSRREGERVEFWTTSNPYRPHQKIAIEVSDTSCHNNNNYIAPQPPAQMNTPFNHNGGNVCGIGGVSGVRLDTSYHNNYVAPQPPQINTPFNHNGGNVFGGMGRVSGLNMPNINTFPANNYSQIGINPLMYPVRNWINGLR